MSGSDSLRELIIERLTAAAEEIFGLFERTVVQYEEEIDRQRRLLDISRKPEIKLHRTDMDNIATFVREALPMCSTPTTLQPIMDVLKDIGVETLDDMRLIQINDLADVLRPIQARKLIAHIKSVFSAQTDAVSSMEDDVMSTPQTPETLRVTTSPSIPFTSGSPGTPKTTETPFRTSFGSRISSPFSSEWSSPITQLGSDWHYSFQVPWNMVPAVVREKLHNQERPTARERREVIRIIAAEILATCKTPAKKHLSEVARKMVLEYPKSFTDIIEGEVIGSGYDSLTKQLQCRVDNYKRNKTLGKKRSIPDDISTVPENKKQQKDSYGCIQWESGPVNVEAQMKKKKDMQKMFLKNERNEKQIEQLISDTFISQRNDIMSGKGTRALTEEWPLLFSLVGMKTHFKLLTGVHINEEFEEAMASKLATVLEYFQSLPCEKTSVAAKERAEIQAGGGPCGAVLMLLSHFKEDRARMFHVVDRTCIAVEVDREHLPPTPCIVVCGESPLSATAFMVAADQEVMMDNLKSFTDALVGMFMCFYIFNMHYPVELGATMEFLQRSIFKINPDKGSKVERQEKKKSNAVNPKVLTLINRIAEFEWSP
ncbi:uncharacterized protein LOC125010923 [Mugil cephalus]|uniref:uncharacterized protein LOC125010923 n=1 Tax=Mugil cephalus TaxID=48193 RepID=UPI001FB5F913|nr:uncharacterized protein LOC125010923 [Mugil cephalus]XP_047445828.1 uncharacterized protein LOC125010923 [Mugil cephalus]